MRSSVLMLDTLVASFVCFCWGIPFEDSVLVDLATWKSDCVGSANRALVFEESLGERKGDSTGGSLFSASPPDSDSDFALEIANSYIARVMLAPLEEQPMTYGTMTSPQDSATTSAHQDPYPTEDSKLEPEPTSPKKSLEDQVDDLLTILRDIPSFVMTAFPGAGRIEPRTRFFEKKYGYRPTTPHDLALQNGSAMRIMEALLTWSATPPHSGISIHGLARAGHLLLTIAMDPWAAVKDFWVGIPKLFVTLLVTIPVFTDQRLPCFLYFTVCFVCFIIKAIPSVGAHLIGLAGKILSPFRTANEKTL
ncbi:hypothetical protein FPANT_8307 [Fusarium pseudoanthophilum]|uniref:Uncharacterized protein n=1 Tax=Fusarium pseudoanthophilum TaxID=48495 RepID=A0A8H5L042_9HYPO|nr:hypothetical protein FPANT_8307 [Fusarium pseudoanthophilum]